MADPLLHPNPVSFKPCSVESCGKPAEKRGMCGMHYQRMRTHGHPDWKPPHRASPGEVQAWINEHVHYSGDECLTWPFSKRGKIIGNVNLGGVYTPARRLMCELANGKPPTSRHISAHIGDDGGWCINPNHLQWVEPGGEHAQTLRGLLEAGVIEAANSTTDMCLIVGCNKQGHTLGLCVSHYKRLMRHGNPLGGGTYKGQAVQWLLDHISHDGDDCLLWPFSRDGNGYACIDKKLGSGVGHRVMCIWAHGEPPTPEHEAAHLCGNGHLGCVNPNHLTWKTHHENMQDVFIHGTHNRGERNGMSVLTKRDVTEIRRLYGSVDNEKLASRYNVEPHTIYTVGTRRAWEWLD